MAKFAAWLLAFSFLFGISYVAGLTKCHMSWSDSGFETNYQVFKGCRLKVDGKWLPASSVKFNK